MTNGRVNTFWKFKLPTEKLCLCVCVFLFVCLFVCFCFVLFFFLLDAM